MASLTTALMVICGALVLVAAIHRTLHVLAHLEHTQAQERWRTLLALMVMFVAGYLGFLALLTGGIELGLTLLCGAIFLGGALFVLLVVSATEHALIELLEIREDLDGALAANQAKSRFLANMSHELRTPLNAIIGYAELVEEELRETEQLILSQDLDQIQMAGRHLLTLIDDLLDLTKIEAGRLELDVSDVDVLPLVAELATTLRPLLDQHENRLEIEVTDEIGAVRADPLRLRQCLHNLLSNAAKFTRRGTVHLSAARGPDHVCLIVQDDGIGMSSEQLARVFEAFEQADGSSTRRVGGSGLGLTLTRQLVRGMGGRLEVESQLGVGSRFTITLPGGGPGAHPESATEALGARSDGAPGPQSPPGTDPGATRAPPGLQQSVSLGETERACGTSSMTS